MSLKEIAFRRLGGVYLAKGGSVELDTAGLYHLSLLGFKPTKELSCALASANDAERFNIFGILSSNLNPSQRKSINTKVNSFKAETFEEKDLKTLALISDDDLQTLFANIVEQRLPFSEQDTWDLVELAEVFSIDELRANARENNATLANLFSNYDWTVGATVTDALRVATAWSNGDVSLTENTKFKLRRAQRAKIANTVERILETNDYAYFDFARQPERWKRLVKQLHVGDYKVPNLQGAARLIYEGQLSSLDSLLEYLIRTKDFEGLMVHFRTMPGVFARRLHELIRKMPEKRGEILEEFGAVAPRVSTRVLVQMYNYFNGPDRKEVPNLPFAAKSRSARNGLIENRRVGSYSDVLEKIDFGLQDKLSGQKIYLDESGKKVAVLTSNRSSSNGADAVGAGSRVPVGESNEVKFITLFTHWKDMENGSRVDLDLSAMFLDASLTRSEHLAYYSTDSQYASYSGDITSAPNGAEEYITIDVQKAKDKGFRYVAIVINSYTGQNISGIPDCYAGLAVAKQLKAARFKSSDVVNRFALNANGREVIPLMLDLETLEMIWVDMNFAGARHGANMSGSNSLASVLKFIVNYNGMTIENLVEKTGAILVDSEEEADMSIDGRRSEEATKLLA